MTRVDFRLVVAAALHVVASPWFAKSLIVIGGAFLFAGLYCALSANRDESSAIASTQIGEGIYHQPIDRGAWARTIHLSSADQRFRWGIWLTAVGILLQTIGGVL